MMNQREQKEQREQLLRQQQAIQVTLELLRHTSRLFHDPKHTVALDYITRLHCVADDTLAERLQCQLKDAHRILAFLRDERFIRVESRQETGGVQAPAAVGGKMVGTTRMYAWVDYRQAVRAIRWRLERMREASEGRLRADLERKGYKCGQCGKRWSPLDVQSLVANVDGFQCDNCELTVVTDGEDDDQPPVGGVAKKRPQELHVQLMETVAPLVQLLKRIGGVEELPVLKFTELLANLKAGSCQTDDHKELKTPAGIELAVTVELESADATPTKNEMPVWYTHSTVTGEKLLETHHLDGEDSAPQSKKSRSVEIVFGDFDDIPAVSGADQDPVVLVRDVRKAFSSISEEDKRMMTSEEYEAYFEQYLRIQGQE